MEASQFDRLTKSLSEAGTRRRLLGALATVPVLGGLAVAIDETVAKRGKGKRRRRQDAEHELAQEKRKKGSKKGKKKKKKKGGPGTTASPSTTRPPGKGETCDDLAFIACFGPWLNEWDAGVGGCSGACAAGANAACEQCLEAAVEPLVEPFAQCFERSCQGMEANSQARSARREAGAAPAICNPLELSKCDTSWLVAGMLFNLALTQGLGFAFMQAQLTTFTGKLLFKQCRQKYGCPFLHDCHIGPSSTEGVCCEPCHRYDPGSQTCVASCAADEACNAFGQCRKTCKQCYDYLVNGRQMPCGQITNNCGTVLQCNGCASTERCQNRRCVPQSCAPGRNSASADECCLPETCEGLGKSCGEWPDGCGGVLDCGSCCVPATCDPEIHAYMCDIDDGCGGKLNCCPESMICNLHERPWGTCCTPSLCGNFTSCVYDVCSRVCRACGSETPAHCGGDASCWWPGGWLDE